MPGFIHDKLDIKLLVLYLMDRVAAGVDFPTLSDLAMCDGGVDYFRFAEAVGELTDSGHLERDGELFTITDKGRRASAAGESSLSPVIRRRCDGRLEAVNRDLRRRAQVRSEVTEQPGGFDVSLHLSDEHGTLLSLTLLCPTREAAQRLAGRFQAHPDRVYNGLLAALLADGEEGEPS